MKYNNFYKVKIIYNRTYILWFTDYQTNGFKYIQLKTLLLIKQFVKHNVVYHC